jgi:hypothetical protein
MQVVFEEVNIVNSASAPSCILALGKLNIALAFVENRDAIFSLAKLGNKCCTVAKVVSMLAIPALAFSNSTVFPSQSCGIWCELIQSTISSSIAFSKAA